MLSTPGRRLLTLTRAAERQCLFLAASSSSRTALLSSSSSVLVRRFLHCSVSSSARSGRNWTPLLCVATAAAMSSAAAAAAPATPASSSSSHFTPAAGLPAEAKAVLDFWCEAGPAKWFTKNADFDEDIRRRFLGLHERAAAGELDAWAATDQGLLALIILLDQFPRNLFRQSPRAFATDPLALRWSRLAIERGADARLLQSLGPAVRAFIYLPLMHSEKLADQDDCVRLMNGDPYAKEHRDIIQRFGRFPHRNDCLGRTTTDKERVFLDDPKSFKG